MASVRAVKAGLSREVYLKIRNKYDAKVANECLEWIQQTINSKLAANETRLDIDTDGSQENFYAVLRDGVVLAQMANALHPGSVNPRKFTQAPKLAFKQMELIELFIKQAKAFGVPDQECFQTVDLYEQQSLHQVLVCIQALGRKATIKGLHGIGPKEATAHPRKFSDQQLRGGQSVIGLQMGTNKGASQAGMTFGKNRMIID